MEAESARGRARGVRICGGRSTGDLGSARAGAGEGAMGGGGLAAKKMGPWPAAGRRPLAASDA